MIPQANIPPRITLRPTAREDVPALHDMQTDPTANVVAGTKPRSPEAFFALWDGILADPASVHRTILVDGTVAGAITLFTRDSEDEVGYWIDRRFWNQGVASRAVGLFLSEVRTRPLSAHVTRDNLASQRTLEKNGFRRTGSFIGEETDRYLAGEVVTYRLEA